MVDSWERFCWISKTISVRSRILKPHVMDVRDMTMWSSIHQRSKISFQHSKASRNWLDSLTWTTWNLSHQHVDFYEPKWTYVRKIPAAVVPNIVSLLGSPYTPLLMDTSLSIVFLVDSPSTEPCEIHVCCPSSRLLSIAMAYFCWKYLGPFLVGPPPGSCRSVYIWLVVLTILKKISQWEGLSHTLWRIKHVPNHQPDMHLG